MSLCFTPLEILVPSFCHSTEMGREPDILQHIWTKEPNISCMSTRGLMKLGAITCSVTKRIIRKQLDFVQHVTKSCLWDVFYTNLVQSVWLCRCSYWCGLPPRRCTLLRPLSEQTESLGCWCCSQTSACAALWTEAPCHFSSISLWALGSL